MTMEPAGLDRFIGTLRGHSLFEPGANTVRLYLVERTRAGPRLRPVTLTG